MNLGDISSRMNVRPLFIMHSGLQILSAFIPLEFKIQFQILG